MPAELLTIGEVAARTGIATSAKLDQLDAQIAKAEAARHAIEHSLYCPQGDILACPMFWKTVNGVADGQPLTEAHGH
jgi:hypothetical protein